MASSVVRLLVGASRVVQPQQALRLTLQPRLATRAFASNVPKDRAYTKDHEWVIQHGEVATVGITEFAQSELGDIVYVDLPEVGSKVTKGSSACAVESVKAASDIYSPLTGEIVEANTKLSDEPDLVNRSPYQDGWVFKVKVSNTAELKELMTPEAYAKHLETAAHH
eukprot:TRINITY_DN889_c0_g1::TRINITY_DN889_c0_g1_i1::g.25389::m.25389 TRINITY_DN889_c0_g1::TRINITY_DN889_c0_g1_i1::g.25389  ORF type:complete len:181 (+),score=56.68,sp/Q72LB0/GCSH_THET2/52.76/9e-44,GCV_H/PF01597.14/7.3e-49,Biotin_lipoyl/PF00364.17/0.001,Biotin_lipoyl/PF00364.17/8e+03 TRINITY_DN889_c0_g1_i1:44-544(+)